MAVLSKATTDPASEIHEAGNFDVQSRVAEMGTTSAEIGPDIPMNAEALARIRSQDNDPRFLVVEIEETPMSRSGRNWPGEIIRSIAEQVNSKLPVGYKGHIPEREDSTAFPDVEAIWLGAVVAHHAGKMIARVKGYLLPNSKARQYAEIGAVDSVSVRGDIMGTREKGGIRVRKFDLESIDFARKGRNGMPARIVAITSEMTEGGNSVEPKDIAAIDENELRTHNPLLVQKIESDARASLETKVSEMETAATAVEPKIASFDEICEKLGIEPGQNPVEAVVALIERVEGAAKAHVKSLVDAAIAKVAGKDERAQNLVRRLVGEQIEREFADAQDDGKLNEQIESKVSEMVEADEDVKSIVGEMGGNSSGGGNSDDGKGERGRHVSRMNTGGGESGRTGALRRSKSKLA